MNHLTVSQARARARGRLTFAGPVLVAATVATIFWASAGQLNPPAGPINPTGPTTLNQQDIGAGPLFNITTSGSYILTSDIVAPAGYTGDGIVIDAGADGTVTLDLNGFAVVGVAGSGIGINVPCCNLTNVVIRNGYVRSWGSHGIDAWSSVARIERITAIGNGGWGISSAAGAGDSSAHIISCEARANGSGVNLTGGIHGQTSIIVDCLAKGNFGDGIRGNGSITGCVADLNMGDGIEAGDSLIQGNSSTGNTGAAINDLGGSILVDNNT